MRHLVLSNPPASDLPLGLHPALPYRVPQYVFMDMQSYEETRIPRDEDWVKYLKEGMDVGVLLWNGKVREPRGGSQQVGDRCSAAAPCAAVPPSPAFHRCIASPWWGCR